ncbi:cytochrome P450 [Actinocrispum sp. NPDC049592]|uniref:cytochrome P450 n=1 Tax=Actinocrispum sp. NPDC049592 TaxID=3154835 RepID=UPI003427C7BF
MRSYPFGPAQRLELHPLYGYVREHEPLCRVRLPFGEDGWLVTRHQDVRAVYTDPRFSRAAGIGRDEPRVTEYIPPRGIMDMDPPHLTRLRRLVAGAFTARRVERLRTRAVTIATELADRLVDAGPPADLVEDFGVPLPVTMICELLGVPVEDRSEFRVYAEAFVSGTSLSGEERAGYVAKLMAYFAGLVRRRREEPTDDLLSALVAARDGQGRLSEDELLFLAAGLLGAGFETTATMIPNFVFELLTHPDQLALLLSRRELVPSAVEELMRFVPLATGPAIPRWALEDVSLSGGVVPAGSAVFASRSAANRDPSVFRDPDTLDITRQPNPHMGFGHGIHHCLGAQLARLELAVALEVLLDRLPGLEFAVPPRDLTWRMGNALRALATLPVRFG